MCDLLKRMLVLCALFPLFLQANEMKSLVIELNNSNSMILNLSETPQVTNCGKNLFVKSKEFSGEIEFINVKKFYYSTLEASSIPEQSNEVQVSIYPNPSSDYIYIATDKSDVELECYDVNGKIVKLSKSYDGQKYQINLSTIPVGTYILYIDKQIFKFIKH